MSQKILYIPRKVNFEPKDYVIVQLYAGSRGLGAKGYSAAIRMIIREWAQLTNFVENIKLNADSKPE